MEQNKNRYSKPKFTKLEIVFLILAGVFLILAIVDKIISVHADEIIEPPHDSQYNNLVFITMSDEMIIGGDTVIELFEGSADGYYATIWKNNFIQAINDFFQYVPKDQCFIIVASDGATSAHMTAIREVLSDVGASYWSGSQDGYWDPNTDYSGYEDKRAPAGDYFIRYMSRIVKYAPSEPTASPTPTPDISSLDPEFSFFVHGKPFWSQSLVGNVGSQAQLRYYLVDVFASNIYDSLDIDIQGNTALAIAMSEYGVAPPWVRPAVVKSYNATDNAIYIYFSGNLYGLKIYEIGEVLPTHNMSFIRDNYNVIDWILNTEYGSSFYAGSDKGLNCVSLFLSGDVKYGTSETPNIFDLTLSRYGEIEISGRPFYNAAFNTCFNSSYNNSINSALVQAYRVGLDYSPVSDITPTPDPNAPSPSPAPTDIPYIQIVTPPLPSPVGTIGFDDPGFSKLNSGSVNNQFEDFEDTLENNAAFGLLAMAFSFVPMELRSIVWLILLIAIILATIRVFLHFFG